MVLKTSTHIGRKAAQTLYYAIGEQAERIGLPITHHVTINFGSTDIAPEKATVVFQELRRNYFDKWARRPRKGQGPKFVPAYAYVFENAKGGRAFDTIGPNLPHNVHVHWALHIPAERSHDFKMKLYEWLDQLCDRPCEANAIEVTCPPIKNLRRYMLEGTDRNWASRYGATHKPQGMIIGKRCGTSVNLGPTARIALDQELGIRRRAA